MRGGWRLENGANDLWGKNHRSNHDLALEIIKTYGNELLRTVYLMLGDFQEAEDIIQETLWLVIHKPESYRENRNFKSYLFTIALNLARDRLRSFWRKRIKLDDQLKHSKAISSSAEELALKNFRYKSVTAHVLNLPVDYKTVIVLHYYQEMSIIEISEILNWPEGTVKSKLHRARTQLKKQIEKGGLSFYE